MATFRITAPDGNEYDVDAPDDATEDQVMAYAQQNYQQATGGQSSPIRDLPAVRAEVEPVDPTSDSDVENYLAGLGQSFVNRARGVRQAATELISQPLSAVANVYEGLTGGDRERFAPLRAPERAAERMRAEATENARLDAPLLRTKAGLGGAVTGELAQLAGPAFLARNTRAAPAFLPTSIRGNAAQGAVIGATQPVGTEDSRTQNIVVGGGVGGVAGAVPQVIGAAVRGARNIASGGANAVDRRAIDIISREAGVPAGNLSRGLSGVPGVTRTLGEESLNPGVMALENTMRAGNRAIFDPIDSANNLARVRALEGIAGTDADMAAAEAARDAASTQLRRRAYAEGDEAARAQQQASALVPGRAPSSQRSQLVSTVRGIAGANSGRPTVQSALNDVASALERAPDTVSGLHGVRMYIGDLLSGKAGSDKGYAKAASAELLQMRDALDKQLATRAPSFTSFLQAFQEGSRPINRMQVGRDLIERGSAGVRDETGTPRILPGTFAKANDLDEMAAKATGFAKAKAADILSADDMSLIRSIQDDLQRQFKRQGSATAGSQTFERGEVGKRVAGRVAQSLPFGIGDVVRTFDALGTQRLKERVAYLVANPNEARRVASALQPRDRAALEKLLTQLPTRGAIATQSALSEPELVGP